MQWPWHYPHPQVPGGIANCWASSGKLGGALPPQPSGPTDGWDFRSDKNGTQFSLWLVPCVLNTWFGDVAQATHSTWQRSQWDFAKVPVDPMISHRTEWTLKSGSGKEAKSLTFLSLHQSPPALCENYLVSLSPPSDTQIWMAKPNEHHQSQHRPLHAVALYEHTFCMHMCSINTLILNMHFFF